MQVIPLYIVSGFIGSGKTTFLKIILDRFGYENRIGIVQNEFPISSIDTSFKEMAAKSFSLFFRLLSHLMILAFTASISD